MNFAYLLLLHKLSIWAVVYHMTPKHRSCKWGIDLFGADISKLAVQNEIVPLGAQVDGCLLTEENECEDIAILR